MSRAVRRVPANWVHPRYTWDHPYVLDEGAGYLIGRYIGMMDCEFDDMYNEWKTTELPEWLEGKRLWDEEGKVMTYADGYDEPKRAVPIAHVVEEQNRERSYNPVPNPPTYKWWAGDEPVAPSREDYMPQWTEAEATHYMMYETTSEGTPISPAFATPEELARWLADTGASTFADCTATYDQWLKMIVGDGYAVSAVMVDGKMMGGVEYQAENS